MFRFLRSGVLRPFAVLVQRSKVSIGASIFLASLAGVACGNAYSQSAFFAGAEMTVPTGSLNQPNAIATDSVGNLYIADTGNARVLKMTLSNGSYTESVVANGIGQVRGIAVDSNGNVYFGDAGTGLILKETPSGSGGYSQSIVSTSSLTNVGGLAVDTSGNVYVVDTGSSRVLKETLSGSNYTESTIGSGLASPRGIAVDATGNVFISDTGNGRVLMETLSGTTYTQSALIPSGIMAYGLAVASGNLYIADAGNHQLLQMPSSGGVPSSPDVIPTSALNNPAGLAIDSKANIYIAQAVSGSAAVLKEFPFSRAVNFGTANVGTSSTGMTVFFTFSGAGTIGKPAVVTQGATGLDFNDANTGSCTTNGTAHTYSTNDTCAVNVTFKANASGSRFGAAVLLNSSGNPIATAYLQGSGTGPQVTFPPGIQSTLSFTTPTNPYAMAVDAAGNLYITQTAAVGNPNSVVKETWNGSGYTETTVRSGLVYPVGVAVDGAGNVYIADQDAPAVYKESPTSSGGYTQTAAFTGLGTVEAVAVDPSGNVYIGSLANHLVKESLLLGSYFSSSISTAAYPWGIAIDANGNLFFSGNDSNLYEVALPTGDYTTKTIASGFGRVIGVAVDGNNNLYVADIGSRTVFKETPSGGAYTQSTLTTGLGVEGIAVDGQGNLFMCGDDVADGVGIWKLDLGDPPSLNFATTGTGSTSSDSPKTVTVQNAGNAPLSLPVPATGNNPSIAANFSLDSSNAGACPLVSSSSSSAGSLAAGASCTLPVSFTPTAAGNLSGSLTLTDNAFNPAGGNATQAILLSGTATGVTVPSITWAAPAPIAFGTGLSATQLDATSAVAGTYAYSPAAGTQLSLGSHTLSVTFTPADPLTYTTATATTTITVIPATPAITWNNPAPITYGTALGAAQLDATSTVPGVFTYSPASGAQLNAGSHTLTVTFTPTDSTDYTPATGTAKITINQATPAITWAAPASIAYGSALSTAQLNATSSVAGTFAYSPAAGAVLNAGSQTLSVTFTPTDAINYATTTATTNLTVSPIAPTLSFAAIPTQPNGVAPFAVSATSASSGAVSYSVVSGPATVSGNTVTITGAGTVALSASQAASGNYSAATATTSFTVAGPFTLATTTGSPSGVTVTSGGTATFALTLTPGSGTTALVDDVTLAATGFPTGATVTFSSPTVAKGSGATAVSLTIQVPSTQTAHSEGPFLYRSKSPILWGFLLFPLAGLTCARRRLLSSHRLLTWLAFAAVLGTACLSVAGCGGGSGGGSQAPHTPVAQSYTVVATAMDKTTGVRSAVNLTLTVQ